MATFVLVHPAWFGGWCWKKVAPILRGRGHEVFTPTLTGLGERAHLANREVGLGTHIEDVANVLKFEDIRDAILVGNSSGGMVITGVADRMPERIAHVVYLDAFVPEDGQSLFDIVPPERSQLMRELVQKEGDGWLVPRFAPPQWEKFVPEAWHITDQSDLRWVLPRLTATPLGHFTEPVRRINTAAERLPRTYIRCTVFPNPIFDRYSDVARSRAGWRHRELAANHLPFITHPDELVGLLLEAVG